MVWYEICSTDRLEFWKIILQQAKCLAFSGVDLNVEDTVNHVIQFRINMKNYTEILIHQSADCRVAVQYIV